MRTTILLDDELIARMRERARAKGQSLSAFIADAGRAALAAEKDVRIPAFELVTYGEAGVHPGINLDRIHDLLVAEDKTRYGA